MVAGQRGMRVRIATLATALIVGLPTFGLLAASVALAANPPAPTTTCNASNQNVVKYTTAYTTKGYARARSDLILTAAPGQPTGTRAMSSTATLSGSVTVSAGASVSVSAVVASATTNAGVALQVGVAWTTGETVTVGPLTNTTGSYRDAVSYFGTRQVVGKYTKWKCVLNQSVGFWTWTAQTTNNYTLWNQDVAGMIWCNDDATIKAQYGSWSIQYDAVSKC